MTAQLSRPEIGSTVVAAGVRTNYLESGSGDPVVLVHGSGPGVSAYANWRLTIPVLAEQLHVFAPDMAGFGFSDKPGDYSMSRWSDQLVGLLDALGLERASLVGNSFGGSLVLDVAAKHPDRVDKLVLMGACGVPFEITDGLDRVWGYEPSIENMRSIMDVFAFDRNLVTDELAEIRYRASIEPGVQEAFASMFPAPRQRWVDSLVTPDEVLRALPHETLVIHGRDDQVIPLENAERLVRLIHRAQLHVFGRCGHWTQIEWASEFSELVRRFLTAPAR